MTNGIMGIVGYRWPSDKVEAVHIVRDYMQGLNVLRNSNFQVKKTETQVSFHHSKSISVCSVTKCLKARL